MHRTKSGDRQGTRGPRYRRNRPPTTRSHHDGPSQGETGLGPPLPTGVRPRRPHRPGRKGRGGRRAPLLLFLTQDQKSDFGLRDLSPETRGIPNPLRWRGSPHRPRSGTEGFDGGRGVGVDTQGLVKDLHKHPTSENREFADVNGGWMSSSSLTTLSEAGVSRTETARTTRGRDIFRSAHEPSVRRGPHQRPHVIRTSSPTPTSPLLIKIASTSVKDPDALLKSI